MTTFMKRVTQLLFLVCSFACAMEMGVKESKQEVVTPSTSHIRTPAIDLKDFGKFNNITTTFKGVDRWIAPKGSLSILELHQHMSDIVETHMQFLKPTLESPDKKQEKITQAHQSGKPVRYDHNIMIAAITLVSQKGKAFTYPIGPVQDIAAQETSPQPLLTDFQIMDSSSVPPQYKKSYKEKRYPLSNDHMDFLNDRRAENFHLANIFLQENPTAQENLTEDWQKYLNFLRTQFVNYNEHITLFKKNFMNSACKSFETVLDPIEKLLLKFGLPLELYVKIKQLPPNSEAESLGPIWKNIVESSLSTKYQEKEEDFQNTLRDTFQAISTHQTIQNMTNNVKRLQNSIIHLVSQNQEEHDQLHQTLAKGEFIHDFWHTEQRLPNFLRNKLDDSVKQNLKEIYEDLHDEDNSPPRIILHVHSNFNVCKNCRASWWAMLNYPGNVGDNKDDSKDPFWVQLIQDIIRAPHSPKEKYYLPRENFYILASFRKPFDNNNPLKAKEFDNKLVPYKPNESATEPQYDRLNIAQIPLDKKYSSGHLSSQNNNNNNSQNFLFSTPPQKIISKRKTTSSTEPHSPSSQSEPASSQNKKKQLLPALPEKTPEKKEAEEKREKRRERFKPAQQDKKHKK